MISSYFPKKYDLDGVYFRVNRNDKWESICFSDLMEEEQREVLDKYGVKELSRMFNIMTLAINHLCQEYVEEVPGTEEIVASYLRYDVLRLAKRLHELGIDFHVREKEEE